MTAEMVEKTLDDGGQAFPSEHVVFEPIGTDGLMQGKQRPLPGMSMRDWFAGQALAGLLAHTFDDGSDFLNDMGPDAAAYQSYRMADAMILARKGSI